MKMPQSAYTGASPSANAQIPRSSRTVAARAFVHRCIQGFTWRRAGALVLLCAVYALRLDPGKGGGFPDSFDDYVGGIIHSLKLFAPVFAAVIIADNFAPRQMNRRALVLGLVATVGAAIGFAWYYSGGERGFAGMREEDVLWIALWPLQFLAISWLGLAVYLLLERDKEAAQALHEEILSRTELDRQQIEAHLQVLQSQIEPHFLFNTLANVRRLYQTDPVAGRAMMRHLSRYLLAALPAMRESDITLRHELELAAAYLNVQQIRMGRRLGFSIDVPEELLSACLPPMMLTTLVENAIKHGLAPLPEGGSVRISATDDGGALRLRVSDTGQGLRAGSGAGVGLANIRSRLQILYGSVARLTLTRNEPQGVTATIELPRRDGTTA